MVRENGEIDRMLRSPYDIRSGGTDHRSVDKRRATNRTAKHSNLPTKDNFL